jgi:curved DNA-binding protein CbpA
MEIKGNLQTMPIPDILQWLADSNKTGTLVVQYKSEKKEIYFEEGVIVSASSNLNKDRFGVLIVKDEFVSQDDLLKLLEEGKQKGKLLGKLCVEKGILTEEQVQNMLQQQAEKIIESLFHRREGDFVFIEGELKKQDLVPISIVMHQLFFDSASKRTEWKRIHDKLGSLDTSLKPAPSPPVPLNTLSEFEQLVLTHCDGKKTILDICGLLDRSDFEVCTTLTKLVEKKWLMNISEQKTQTDKDMQDKIWQVSILTEQKRYLQAIHLLEALKSKFPKRSDIETLLNKITSLLNEDIGATFKDESNIPVRCPDFDNKMLQGLGFKSQEWFVFSQINGLTPLKNLYLISSLGKNETQRIIYVLLKSGAVKFKSDSRASSPFQTISKREVSAPVAKKEDLKSAPEKPTHEIPKQDTRLESGKIKTDPPKPVSPDKIQTAVIKIPDQFLTKKDEKKSDSDSSNIPAPDLKELNKIYTKYRRINHYDKLNIGRNADATQIREAYFVLCKKYHPDRYSIDLQKPIRDKLEELFSIVNQAYSVLSNPVLRKRYDEEIWANERFGSKELEDLASLIQTSENTVVTFPRKSPPSSQVKSPKKPEEKTKPIEIKTPEKKPEQKPQTPPVETKKEPASKPVKSSKWEEFFQKGCDLLKADKAKLALDELEQAVKINAKNAELYYYLSVAYLKTGKTGIPKAEENIKKALILDRENPRYFCQLAQVALEKGSRELAERFLKTALAWNAEYKPAKDMLKEMKGSAKKGFFGLNFLKKDKN